MPFRVEIFEEDRVVLHKQFGFLTIEDYHSYAETLEKIETDLHGFIEYVDLSGVVDSELTFNSIHLALDIDWPILRRGLIGTLLYAPTDFAFGISRMTAAVLSNAPGYSTYPISLSRVLVPFDSLRDHFAGIATAMQ